MGVQCNSPLYTSSSRTDRSHLKMIHLVVLDLLRRNVRLRDRKWNLLVLGKWLMVSGQPDGGGQVGNEGLGFDLDNELKNPN